MKASRSQHVTVKGAHAHETSVSVTFGAPCVGTILGAVSECSKYVTFSIAFGAPVLQTTVGVMFGARRRSVPPRLLETSLATWAAKAGHDFGAPPPGRNHVAKFAPTCPGQPYRTPPRSPSDVSICIFRSRLRHAYEVAMRTKWQL